MAQERHRVPGTSSTSSGRVTRVYFISALAETYLKEGVVPAKSRVDAQHIAIATLARVDVLVSWNFKHIVNLQRIRGYNSVNLKLGYPILETRSPNEVLNY